MLALRPSLTNPANDALPIPIAPTLRLLRSAPASPDWHLFTYVLHFLLEARTPSGLAHRAAASLGLLPQVAWTDLEGRPDHGPESLAIPLEREPQPEGPAGAPNDQSSVRWLEIGLAEPGDDDARALVKTLLSLVAKLHARELEAQRLADAAYRDVLTGLWNRRGFITFMDQALARRARTGSSLALMVCDLDHFKQINDSFGHAAGDLALRHVAKCMQGVIRPSDIAARLGGDELVMLLNGADGDGAKQVAARLKRALDDDNPLAPHPLTLSIGIADDRIFARADEDLAGIEAAANNVPLETVRKEFFAAADRALYRAKENGRNQACLDTFMGDDVGTK